jgi:TonB family protein
MMGGDRPNSDEPEAREDYEATVIDFLDRELTASAKPAQGHDGAPDELDTLVTNLLKDVITTSDREHPTTESGEEDFDALLSGIFQQSEADPVPPNDAPAEPGVSDDLKVEPDARPANVPVPIEEALVASKSEPGPPVLHQEVPQEVAKTITRPETRIGEPKPTATAITDPYPAFALKQKASVSSNRGFLIAIAFLSLVASIGFGVYRLAGRSSSQGTVSVNPQPALSAPLNSTQPAPVPVSRDEKPQVRPAATQPTVALHAVPDAAAAARGKPGSPAESPKPANPIPARNASDSARESKSSTDAPPSPAEVKPEPKPSVPSNANASSNDVPAAAPPAPVIIPAVEPVLQKSDRVENVLPEPRSAHPAVDSAASPKSSSASVPARPSITPPVSISKVKPAYPEVARRTRSGGTVVIDIAIDTQGSVTDARVVSGPPVLGPAALDAVKKWRYKPASYNGKSVPGAARVSIEFNP